MQQGRVYSAGLKAKNLPARLSRKQWHWYVVAWCSLLLAWYLQIALAPLVDARVLLVLFAISVLVSTAFGGAGAGLVGTAITALATYSMMTLTASPLRDGAQEPLRATLQVTAAGLLVTLLTAMLRVSVRREDVAGSARLVTGGESAVAAANCGFWHIDLETGRIIQSENMSRVFAMPRGNTASIPIWKERIHADDRARVIAAFTAALTDKSDFECDYRTVGPDGLVTWIACRGTVINAPAGRAASLVGVARDLTSEREEARVRESADSLRVGLERAGFGVARIGMDGSFLEINPQICEMTGFSKDELLRRSVADIARPDDLESVQSQIGDLAKGHATTFVEEEQCARKDGSTFWTRWTVSLIEQHDGHPEHLIAIVEDISARKDREREVDNSERHLRTTVEAIPAGVIFADKEGRILLENRAYAQIWGDSASDVETRLQGRTGWWHATGKPVASKEWPVAQALATGKTSTGNLMDVQTADGGKMMICSAAVPVLDAEANIAGVIAVDENVTPGRMLACASCEVAAGPQSLRASQGLGFWEWDLGRDTLVWCDEGTVLGTQSAERNSPLTWEQVVHPDDILRVRSALAHAVHEREILQVEYRNVRPDGGVRWLRAKGRVLAENGDPPTRMLGSASDVTDLKRAEQDLQLLAALVDSSDDAILSEGVDGIIHTWNRGAEEMFGYSAQEVIGRSVTILERGADQEETLKILARIATGERISHHERIRYRSDGQQICVSQTLCPIYNEDGEIVGVSEVARDISAHKLAEERIQSLNLDLDRRVRARTDELEDANRMLASFVYTASHDLRAPLRSIQGLAQALIEDCSELLDDSGREYARRIVEGTARMDALIRDLLEYSRLTRRELKVEALSLRTAVDEALHSQAAAIVERNAEIHIGDTDVVVLAHELTLVQVIGNLISNAVKFVAPGVRPIVHIDTKTVAGRVRVRVDDNGIGVEQKHHARMFEVFERLQPADDYPGTGIGLAIVRKGIERMGGEVGVESGLGMGSRFWFELRTAAGGRSEL